MDLVLGARTTIPRPSERILSRLTQLKVDVTDSGTGLRALRIGLARDLDDGARSLVWHYHWGNTGF